MSFDSPSPDPSIPTEFVDALTEERPAVLRHIARYAEALAAHRERERRLNAGSEVGDDHSDDLPEGVPSKASITVKEINDNRYYYWQWREGDRIKSKYKGPVSDE